MATAQEKLNNKLASQTITHKAEIKELIHNIKKSFLGHFLKNIVKYVFATFCFLIIIIVIILYHFFQLDISVRWSIIVNIIVFAGGWITRFIKLPNRNEIQNNDLTT